MPGEMALRGKKVNVQSPGQAIEMGIAYLPEDRRHHGVIMAMAIAANITLASLRTLSSFGGLNFARERGIAADYVRRFSIKTPALFSQVATLSGWKSAKGCLEPVLLAVKPSVLILDEPDSGCRRGRPKLRFTRSMSGCRGRGWRF
jgi:ABC-type sugar transport system ATPase subunit